MIVFFVVSDDDLLAPLEDAGQAEAVANVLAAAVLVADQDVVAVWALLAVEPHLDVEEQWLVPAVKKLLGVV